MHRSTDSSTTAHGSLSAASSSSSPAGSAAAAASSPFDATEGHVCPFCGLTRELTDDFDPTTPCPRCTLADTPTTRNATKARIGPWHVRQMRNPWAPGMRWETLLALIKRGQVTKDSVVRGPTTQQLWKRASEVKGLSREFGVCYSCGEEIDTQANLCGQCNRLQEPPANPNLLVETRDGSNGNGASSAKPAASAAGPSAVSARGNGRTSRHRADDVDEAPHLDIGAATPSATDVDDMLTVDDPQAAAEFARQVTSRAPQQQRSNRAATTPPAAKEPAPATPAPSQQKKKQQAAAAASAAAAPPPPPAASRPVALRPRQPGADDALLTPQELAAAFQLDFTPPPPAASGGGGAGAKPSKHSGRAAGLPRRKRSKTSIAFVLLVLIGAGVAALMYLRPDLREQASAWSAEKYASVKQFIASRTTPTRKSPAADSPTPVPAPAVTAKASPATRPSNLGRDAALAQSRQPSGVTPASTPALTPTRAVTPAPRPDPIAIAPAPPPRTKTVVVEPAAPPASAIARETTSAEDVDSSIPASLKSGAPTTPPPAASAPVEIIKIDPPATAAATAAAPKPAASNASANAKSTASQQPAKTWTNLSEAEDEARRLWRLAFDAEQNQDFVEAVSLYEQIKKLPASVHPAGLEVRLSLARKLTK